MPKVKITGLPQMKSGGYTVRKSNARKGKTHVVIGPDGTKKYFGDPKMGERSKSKHGKEAFYARHAKNLKNNPYFRAYARATWADGGMVDMYEGGGDVPTPMYNPSVPEVSVFDLTKQAMGGLIYDDGGTTGPGDPPVVLNPSLVGSIIPTTPIGVKGGTPYDAPRTDINETGVISWLADEPPIEQPRKYSFEPKRWTREEITEMHKNKKKHGRSAIQKFINKAARSASDFLDKSGIPAVKLGCPGGRCHEDGGYVYSMGGMIYSNGGPKNPKIKSNEMQKDSANYTAAHLRMHDIFDKAYPEQELRDLYFDRFFKTKNEDINQSEQARFINSPEYKDFLFYRNINDAIERKYPIESEQWRTGKDGMDARHSPNASSWFQPTTITRNALFNMNKALGGPIKAGEGYVQNDDMSGFAEGGRYATSDSPVPQRTSGLMNYLGYGKPRPFAMGGYNMYFDGGPGGSGGPNNSGASSNLGNSQIVSTVGNLLGSNAPSQSQSFNSTAYISDKEMNPAQWKAYNESRGYKIAPTYDVNTKTLVTRSGMGSPTYPTYYDPTKYNIDETGRYTKSVGYTGEYKPFIEYNPPYKEPKLKKPSAPYQPTREDQGWTKVYSMDEWARGNQKGLEWMKDYAGGQGSAGYNIYMRNAKDPKAFSQPVSDKESYDFFQQYKRNPNTYEELQQYVQGIRKPYNPPGTIVNETGVISTPVKAMGGFMYAQGGSKLPQSILRARLESHMTPEEADNYLANYAGGGNTGTGILGNMTFNPSPWKYVEGGQLGPYPYSGYKSDLSEFKKGGIHIKPENRGKFTASAKKAGMGVQEYARHVLANKENYSPTLVKRANFARNAAKWKHAYGGYQTPRFDNGGPNDQLKYFLNYNLDRARQLSTDTGDDFLMPTEPGVLPTQISDLNYNPSMEGFNMEPMRVANVGSTYEEQAGKVYNPATGKYEEPKMELKPVERFEGKSINPFTLGNKFYYPGQLAQQTLGELAYLAGEGKSYKKAPEYTYTPEQYSARMPLRAIDEAGRAAAMELAARNTGAGNYMANRIALANKLAGAGAKTIEDIDMANMAARNAARQANLTMKRESDLQTLQNEQKALENFYKTIGSVGMKGATTGKDMRAEQMDALKWQYLPEIYKAMALNPELMKKYKEGLGI